MSQYVTLLGAEEVSRAASTMASAAGEMRSAASNLDSAFHCHQRFMDDWLVRFSDALAAHAPAPDIVPEPSPATHDCTHGFADIFACPYCRPF